MKDYYSLLGVSYNASHADIKKGYRIKAIRFHPDKHFGNDKYVRIFLEIKEAYETLNDEEKRKEYNIAYKRYCSNNSESNSENTENNNNQRTENSRNNFRYENFEKHFNEYERNIQDTIQVKPNFSPWGDKIEDNYVIFTLPKKIGKIISGWSSLKTGKKPITKLQLLFSTLRNTKLTLIVIGLILFFIWLHWHFNLHDETATRNLSITFSIISFVILFIKYRAGENEILFKQINYFIGINGFSIHLAKGEKLEVYGNIEINFKDVTDFVSVITINNFNFQYSNTKYDFIWLNSYMSKPLYKISRQHHSKEGDPEKDIHCDYWLNIEAEKMWTIYLLDNMESILEAKGYIEFNLYLFEKEDLVPYIRIGVGFITFLLAPNNITYNFNEIKRLYTKGTDLYIEHKNYQKTLFFFESGDKNYVPLLNLSNRKFFIKAVEILLGYEIA